MDELLRIDLCHRILLGESLEVTLDDLVGEHVLDAFDLGETKHDRYGDGDGDAYDDCAVLRFRLDGVLFTATEDPEDEYRSCMRELKATPHGKSINTIPPTRVLARKQTRDSEYADGDPDVLELVDIVTGKVVLAVGTNSNADYYPSWVGEVHPEALACNAKARP